MKNKYVSISSIGLITCIIFQLIYFSNQLLKNKDISSLIIPVPNEDINLSSFEENNFISTIWKFSDGKPIIINKEKKLQPKKTIVKMDSVNKLTLPINENVQLFQQADPVVSNISRSMRYLGMADSEDKLVFFFEIDGSYVILKRNDIYSNLKLISVDNSNIILTDLQNGNKFILSK